MPGKRLVALGLAAVLALGFPSSALAATEVVKAAPKDKWKPTHAYITAGDTIKWKNPTGKKHNVTAYGKNWTFKKTIRPGETAKYTFDDPGTHRYRCTLHSAIVDGKCEGQCGWVHVFEE